MISVGLIDNDPMILGSAGSWLSGHDPSIEVRHVAAGVVGYLALDPSDDVVLLDLELGDGTRFVDNVDRLMRRGDKVLLLSVHARQRFKMDAVRAGAVGYHVKDGDRRSLVRAIRDIVADRYALDQELAFAISRDRTPGRPRLSDRQAEVVKLRGRGVPMKVIAVRMGIKESTAYGYLDRAKAKYRDAGTPVSTVADIQERLREDGGL
ncbi:response regulator transcription factor [Saccharothrix sp. NRRL B-16314]|uniref:response regulator transcription factor n=1 Tax=Saccharothrix sp. NRRL B-16314 TaxID=1463825 RepID=UPI000524C398|nr:response regulator transcription factor [Saccharothrix sp. NRRL B-16314]